jgi:hypothetical protein
MDCTTEGHCDTTRRRRRRRQSFFFLEDGGLHRGYNTLPGMRSKHRRRTEDYIGGIIHFRECGANTVMQYTLGAT